MLYLNKFVFSIAICLCVSASVLVAETVDLSNHLQLHGDVIDMDDSTGLISASGNVRATQKDMVLSAERFSYNYKTEEVWANGRMEFKTADNVIRTDDFYYNGKSLKGYAKNLYGTVGRFIIDGQQVTFSPRRITVRKAQFTTCDLDHPHYSVNARTIHLYPLFGFFVAHNNHVSIKGSPSGLWIPTFFYGSLNYSLLDLTPFPRVGSSPREGFFVKQSVPYFFSSKSSGSVDFGYLDKLGPTYGFSHLFIFNKSRQAIVKAHSVGSDGFAGGVTLRLDLEQLYGFGLRNRTSSLGRNLFNAFGELGGVPKGLATVQYTLGNLINNSRVDFTPRVQLTFNEFGLFDRRILLTSNAEWADIHENTLEREDIYAWRAIGDISLKVPRRLSRRVVASVSGQYIESRYEDHPEWRRSFAKTELAWDIPFLRPRLFYSKQLSNRGESPFEFDATFIQESDEVGGSIEQSFRNMLFTLDTAYVVNEWRPRQQDYSVSIGLHRVRLMIGYRMVQESFFFGGSI